jgi:hypothetical protein
MVELRPLNLGMPPTRTLHLNRMNIFKNELLVPNLEMAQSR